jgi:hypothetical protein
VTIDVQQIDRIRDIRIIVKRVAIKVIVVFRTSAKVNSTMTDFTNSSQNEKDGDDTHSYYSGISYIGANSTSLVNSHHGNAVKGFEH